MSETQRMSSAEICRMRGWSVGTLLVGDEGYGNTVILITAIGEQSILARTISHAGTLKNSSESQWNLSFREWEPLP